MLLCTISWTSGTFQLYGSFWFYLFHWFAQPVSFQHAISPVFNWAGTVWQAFKILGLTVGQPPSNSCCHSKPHQQTSCKTRTQHHLWYFRNLNWKQNPQQTTTNNKQQQTTTNNNKQTNKHNYKTCNQQKFREVPALLAMLFIGSDALDAMLAQGVDATRQDSQGAEEFVDDDLGLLLYFFFRHLENQEAQNHQKINQTSSWKKTNDCFYIASRKNNISGFQT